MNTKQRIAWLIAIIVGLLWFAFFDFLVPKYGDDAGWYYEISPLWLYAGWVAIWIVCFFLTKSGNK
jgi:hypothetical protein